MGTPSSPSAFRLGRPEEATLASTSAFSTALIRLVPVSSWGVGMAVFLRRHPSRDNSATNCFSSTFSLDLVYLLLGSVSQRVPCQPLPPCLHELLGPCIVRMRLDPLPSTQLVDRHLPAKPLQHDANFLFRCVLVSGSCLPPCGQRTLPPPCAPQRPLPYLFLSGTSLLLSEVLCRVKAAGELTSDIQTLVLRLPPSEPDVHHFQLHPALQSGGI